MNVARARSAREMEPVTGLVLSGGGARGAYQAGVLRGMLQVMKRRPEPHPCYFSIFTGYSAGAINGAFLADRVERMAEGIEELCEFWASLRLEKVFRTHVADLTGIGLRWLGSLVSGGALGKEPDALLDTEPLKYLISQVIDFDSIRNHVEHGCLRGLAVSATSYDTGATVTFFDGKETTEPHKNSLYQTVNTTLRKEHVLASCAIPILFPPVHISGSHFGDGGIRFSTPLSPAMHMGADRIVAIGIRHKEKALGAEEFVARRHRAPSMADVVGVVLNSVFMEALETDVSRARRMNQVSELLNDPNNPYFRRIPILLIQPSEDLGQLAYRAYRKLPPTLKYLLRGIGASPETGADLLSYLAFDPNYTRRLLKLGYEDALERRREIVEFFQSAPADMVKSG